MSSGATFTEVKPPAPCCGFRVIALVSDEDGKIVDMPAICPGCSHAFAVQELVALREMAIGMWEYIDASEHGACPF